MTARTEQRGSSHRRLAFASALVLVNLVLVGLNLAKRDVVPSFGLFDDGAATEGVESSSPTVDQAGATVTTTGPVSLVTVPGADPATSAAPEAPTTSAVDDWPGGHGPVPAEPAVPRRAVVTPEGGIQLTGSAPSWAVVMKIVQYAGEKLPGGAAGVDNQLTWHPDASPDTQWGDVVMDNAATFAVGNAVIDPTSFPGLDVAAQMLVAHPTVFAVVIGHADNVGDDATNAQIALDRANTTVEYLVGKGVLAGQIVVASAGEDNPVATNDTEEGRAVNRRTEIQFKNVLIAEPTFGSGQ